MAKCKEPGCILFGVEAGPKQKCQGGYQGTRAYAANRALDQFLLHRGKPFTPSDDEREFFRKKFGAADE